MKNTIKDNHGKPIPIPTKMPARPVDPPKLTEAASFLAGHLKQVADGNRDVILFGDFDVDGTTSAAIFFLFAKLFRLENIFPYVSKRVEGYGLNARSVKRLIDDNQSRSGRSLVVAMDMGVSSTSETKVLLDAGFDVMVIDHHVPKPDAQIEWAKLTKAYGPDRLFVYDPLLYTEKEELIYSCLSAAGLTYKILTHIMEHNFQSFGELTVSSDRVRVNLHSPPQSIEAVLGTAIKLCSIAQASDCMPYARDGELTEAWALAREFELPSKLLAGVGILYELTHTASRIAWVIGPKINAAGRLEDGMSSFDLMIETDEQTARDKITAIDTIRTKVQTLTRYAEENLATDVLTSKGLVVGMGKKGIITAGIIGIAAARASEAFTAPALYLCEEDYDGGFLKGSMRRGETDFSCEEWILDLKNKNIIIAGGGHPAAAGLSLNKDKLPELLASAEASVFKATPKEMHDASVSTLLDYCNEITKVMPFGKGHESAYLKIRGLLSFVTPLKTKKEGKVWAYSMRISDIEAGESANIKVMSNDLPENLARILEKVSDRRILSPVEVVVAVHDNYKLNSKYERAELRVVSEKPKIATSVQVEPVAEQPVTPSGFIAKFRFLTVEQYERDEAESEKESEKKPQGSASGAAPEVASQAPEPAVAAVTEHQIEAAFTPVPAVKAARKQSLKTVVGTVTDLTNIDNADADVDENQTAIFIKVDHVQPMDRRTFIVRRSRRQGIEQVLGPEGLEAMNLLHGGRYSQSLKGFEVSFGVMARLLSTKDPRFNIIISERAMRHYEDIERGLAKVENEKLENAAYRVPYFREDAPVTPFPFQFADVKFFLKRKVGLCSNDMGTGKTLEAGMWSAFKLAGLTPEKIASLPAEDLKNLGTYGGDKKPVLFVLMKSVIGQFSKELDKLLDVKQSSFITTDVRMFLKSNGFLKGKDADADDGGDADDDENIMMDIAQGNRNARGRKVKRPAGEKSDDKSFKPIRAVTKSIVSKFQKQFIGDSGFVFTTYDTLARHPWIVESFAWSGLVCDEAHELKGSDTHRTKALFGQEIDGTPLHGAPVLALSGTFAKNRPADWFVWVRLTGCDGGIYSEGRLSDARRRFDRRFDGLFTLELKGRGGVIKYVSKRGIPKNGDELKNILYPYLMRRLKTEISAIPTLMLYTHRVTSTGLYNDVISMMKGDYEIADSTNDLLRKYNLMDKNGGLRSERHKGGSDDLEVVDPNTLMGKLSMISSLDKSAGVLGIMKERGWLDSNDAGKTDAFVIMAFHQSAAKEASAQLEKAGISHFLMMQNDDRESREDKKQRFQNGERTAFVTTYGTGGTGLNLTRAHRLMCINLPWNDTALAQARDRVFRLGQTRPCEVCIVLLAGSIDEGVYYLIKNKGRATAKTIGLDQMKVHQVPAWATGGVLDSAASTSAAKHKSPRRKKLDLDKEKEKKAQEFIEAEMGKTGWDV